MSIYLAGAEAPPSFVASNTGWGQFCRWAQCLNNATQLAHLIAYSWSQKPNTLMREIREALPLAKDSNVASVGHELLYAVRAIGGPVVVTDGTAPDLDLQTHKVKDSPFLNKHRRKWAGARPDKQPRYTRTFPNTDHAVPNRGDDLPPVFRYDRGQQSPDELRQEELGIAPSSPLRGLRKSLPMPESEEQQDTGDMNPTFADLPTPEIPQQEAEELPPTQPRRVEIKPPVIPPKTISKPPAPPKAPESEPAEATEPTIPEQPTPAPKVDPSEEYKKLGVRAPAFKSWFGDWEEDPASASKVVSAETGEPAETYEMKGLEEGAKKPKPKPVYHGTARGGFREFKKERIKDPESLLFGPGFYFTEDEETAKTYTEKDAETPRIELDPRGQEATRKFIEQHLPDGVKVGDALSGGGLLAYEVRSTSAPAGNYVRVGARQDPRELDTELPNLLNWSPEVREQWKKILDEHGTRFGNTGEVKAAYLNIRNPFDGDNGLISYEDLSSNSQAALRKEQARIFYGMDFEYYDVRSELEQLEDDELDSKLTEIQRQKLVDKKAVLLDKLVEIKSRVEKEIDESFERKHIDYAYLKAFLGSKKLANQAIQEAGYDGITHEGGKVTGGKSHRVWIAFEPTQIKAITNTGTFDPNDPDMHKTLPRLKSSPFLQRRKNRK